MLKSNGKPLKTAMIENEIYSILGTDILNVEATLPPELQINEMDIISGLTHYYTAKPISNGVSKQLMLLQTNAAIDLALCTPTNDDEWIFMGILSEGRKFNMTSNLLDMRLTGIPLSFMYVNPLQNSYYSTVIDNNVGKPEYFVDEVRKQIVITAGGDVILSLKLAWMSTNLERVDQRHITNVAKLISIPYYERILALRSQVSFNATDYSIDVGLLISKIEENKAKNQEFLSKIRLYIMLKG